MRFLWSFLPTLLLASFAFAQQPAPQLGAANFLPSPANPIGWRGDGTGRFPAANPVTAWSRFPQGFAQLRSALTEHAPAAEQRPLSAGLIQDWQVAGPFPTTGTPAEALESPWVRDESAAVPDTKTTVAWQRLWSRSRTLSVHPAAEDFSAPWDKSFDKDTAFLAHTYLITPQPLKTILLTGDGDKTFDRVFLNGLPIAPDPKNPHRFPLDLTAGKNRLLLKHLGSARPLIRLYPAGDFQFESHNLRWVLRLPQIPTGNNGTSSPIVVGDKIFVTTDPLSLVCVNRANGRIDWVRWNDFYVTIPPAKQQELALPPLLENLQSLLNQIALAASADTSPASSSRALGDQLNPLYQRVQDAHKKIVAAAAPAGVNRNWGRHDGGMSAPSPVSDGQFVYALYAPGLVVAYDLAGKLQWSVALDGSGAPEHGNTASPLLVDGKLICLMKGLTALDAATGKILWTAKVSFGHGTPALFRVAGQAYLATPWPSAQVFRVADGSLAWSAKERFFDAHNNWTSPVGIGDTVYHQDVNDMHSTFSFRSIRFSLSGETLKADIAPRITTPTKTGCPNASPLIDAGFAYGLSRNANLAVFDLQSGTSAYQQPLEMAPTQGWVSDPGTTASPALAGSALFLTDDHLTTTVLSPGKTFAPLAVNYLWSDDYLVASPSFADRDIYLRGNRFLYAIGPSPSP